MIRWVLKDFPRYLAPRNAKALHEAARGPTVDYRDNPQRRISHHRAWTSCTPPSGPIFLLKEHQIDDVEKDQISDTLDETYPDILGYMNAIKVSEDLSYKIDVIVDMLDAVRAYITLSTAHLLNMKVEKDDTQVQ